MAGITNPWERVRNHWLANVGSELAALRSQSRIIKEGAEWSSAVCPLCEDKDGSASISSKTGYLHCRQCGAQGNLFDWLGRKLGQQPLDVMLELAERFGIRVEKKKKGKKSRHCDLESQLELAVIELWKAEEAKPLRDEVVRRGFTPSMFAPYSIGWHGDHLVFPMFSATGEPLPRYHAWFGPQGKPKWRWGGAAKNGVVEHGLWPCVAPPKDAEVILLCAGEWDVLTARERWKLQEQGIFAYTWTGGETTPLRQGLMPAWLKGLQVRVCYDFDVWQGPDATKAQAPSEKAMGDFLRRRKNLLEGVCWPLSQLGCKVSILAVPNPKGEFNADLRDYYDWKTSHKELPSLDEFLSTDYADVSRTAPPRKVSFQEAVSTNAQDRLAFEASIAFIAEDFHFPTVTKVRCEAGSYPFCQSCNLQRDFPGSIIRWEQFRLGLARFLSAKNREQVVWQTIGKPPQCHVATLESESDTMASRWMASDPDSLNRHELLVVGPRVPDFGEVVAVEGERFTRQDSITPVFLADKLSIPERERINVQPFVEKLHALCPWNANDPDELWNHVYFKRHDDLAAWVTGIFNRQNYHIAVDLVAHSALWWIDNTGKKVRGWLDANITGSTRSGKSVTTRMLLDHYHQGAGMLSMQGLWSYAGLIASNEATNDGSGGGSQYRVRPGVVPRFHGKLIVFDELQHTVRSDVKTKLMPMLQEIRDTGQVYIAKIASRKIQCAVRLLTLANPAGSRGFRHYRFPCEALLPLYSAPEAIARMDFAVTHNDSSDASDYVDRGVMQANTPHLFTSDLCQLLVRRAWDLHPEDILVDKEAFDRAVERVEQWKDVYDVSLPLFTGPEKVTSLIRIAIAIANLTFSHPADQFLKTHVRWVHVEWAAQWLEGLWEGSGYLSYSAATKKRDILQPWVAEWRLLELGGADPRQAQIAFEWLLRAHKRNAFGAWLGKPGHETDIVIANLVRAGVYEIMEDDSDRNDFGTTTEGARMLRALLYFCDSKPGEYRTRYNRYSTWWSQANHTEAPSNVEPLPEIRQEDEPGS